MHNGHYKQVFEQRVAESIWPFPKTQRLRVETFRADADRHAAQIAYNSQRYEYVHAYLTAASYAGQRVSEPNGLTDAEREYARVSAKWDARTGLPDVMIEGLRAHESRLEAKRKVLDRAEKRLAKSVQRELDYRAEWASRVCEALDQEYKEAQKRAGMSDLVIELAKTGDVNLVFQSTRPPYFRSTLVPAPETSDAGKKFVAKFGVLVWQSIRQAYTDMIMDTSTRAPMLEEKLPEPEYLVS